MAHTRVALTSETGAPVAATVWEAHLTATLPGAWVRLFSAVDGPWVDDAVSMAVSTGLSVRLDVGSGWQVDDGRLRDLVARGVRIVGVPVPGEAQGLLVQAEPVAGLKRVARVDLVQAPAVEAVMGALHGADLEVHGSPGPDADHRAWLDALWSACASQGAAVRFFDVCVPPAYVSLPGPLPRVVPSLVDVVRGDLALPSLVGGCRVGAAGQADEVLETAARVGDLGSLGRLLGAMGMPVAELPRCEGGRGQGAGGGRCGACPGAPACGGRPAWLPGPPEAPAPWTGVGRGAHVHVVGPPVGDQILLQTTLPGLVQRLREAGAQATLHSVWASPFNPHGSPPDAPPELVDGDEARWAYARDHAADFVRSLDLRGADCVIVPGWWWAEVIFRHRTLPADARLIVADFHLMHGMDRWKKRYVPQGERSLGTAWWPASRLHVHSGFPGYARLVWYAGVPLEQVWWRPYPLHLPVFPQGPDTATCDTIFAGGNHLRDHGTLAAAVRLLPPGSSPVVVCSHRRPRTLCPGMTFLLPLPLPAFRDQLTASRFAVVALEHVTDKAAGISVVAMAQAAGRPVVATAIPGVLDHVRHEVDGLLVPPGDAQALADAITRLDRDDALRARLAAGARQAAERADVSGWAHTIVHGVEPGAVAPAGALRAW